MINKDTIDEIRKLSAEDQIMGLKEAKDRLRRIHKLLTEDPQTRGYMEVIRQQGKARRASKEPT